MNKQLYVSMPCWGDKYINKFLTYSLPTLLAEQNIPALRAKGYAVNFCIYGEPDAWKKYQALEVYQALEKQCNVILLDIHALFTNSESLLPVELFSYCHDHLMSQAAETQSLGLFLCCDALLNHSALSFAVSKIEQGFKAVLNSAVRVNYEDCTGLLEERRNQVQLPLSSDFMVELISEYIHKDEKALAQPSTVTADGWPGIFSWYNYGVGYLKHTFYFNPTLLRCESGMSLRGATFDSSEMMNYFLPNWERDVYVVSDPKELIILDLADKEVNHLPLKQGHMTAMNVALNTSVWKMPAWQNKVFEVACEYSLSGQQNLFAALQSEARLFVDQVHAWQEIFLRHPQAAADQKWSMLADYYRVNFDFSVEKISQTIKQLCDRHQGESIVLYGVGDFCEYLLRQFKFEGCKVYLSDSNTDKLTGPLYGYPVVAPDKIADFAQVVVPLSLKFQYEMRDTILKNNTEELIVEIIDWATLTEN